MGYWPHLALRKRRLARASQLLGRSTSLFGLEMHRDGIFGWLDPGFNKSDHGESQSMTKCWCPHTCRGTLRHQPDMIWCVWKSRSLPKDMACFHGEIGDQPLKFGGCRIFRHLKTKPEKVLAFPKINTTSIIYDNCSALCMYVYIYMYIYISTSRNWKKWDRQPRPNQGGTLEIMSWVCLNMSYARKIAVLKG